MHAEIYFMNFIAIELYYRISAYNKLTFTIIIIIVHNILVKNGVIYMRDLEWHDKVMKGSLANAEHNEQVIVYIYIYINYCDYLSVCSSLCVTATTLPN